jgi:hypothetical protein
MQIPLTPAMAEALSRFRAARERLERKGASGLLPATAGPMPPPFREPAGDEGGGTPPRAIPATPHGRGEEDPGLAALRMGGAHCIGRADLPECAPTRSSASMGATERGNESDA